MGAGRWGLAGSAPVAPEALEGATRLAMGRGRSRTDHGGVRSRGV